MDGGLRVKFMVCGYLGKTLQEVNELPMAELIGHALMMPKGNRGR